MTTPARSFLTGAGVVRDVAMRGDKAVVAEYPVGPKVAVGIA